MFKSMVYYGNTSIGEVEVWPKGEASAGLAVAAWAREIRVDRLSPPSERCPPLAVMHTVAVDARCLVMESRPPAGTDVAPLPLVAMHAACLRDNKTAVVPLGDEELHLVAMTSRRNLTNHACFWGYRLPFGLYNSCLTMLNLRCLGIVFDLDETLIVANTSRSFEDRIDALQRKLNNETDPQRRNGMLSEVKRYQDDKSILKQYIEGDQVCDDGKVYKAQPEVVPPLSDNQQPMTRPIIRLQDKNIILTRINPLIRDTSVLVRLRPAWVDLRSYLIARGRKRFEVYVCTMAERDYALEMWRLLDPDSRLINSVQLHDRMVCVKSGLKKSLLNVFHDGSCHPGMALVIDDRLKVWDEKDQSRVHVVPAFTPYYAPQAEANCSIPVLCVARNVACNVRGSFFKDFDEGLLPRISNISYEDENDISSAPDVGNYLIAEMSLRNLAHKYLSSDPNKMTDLKENGFGSNRNYFGYSGNTRDDMLPVSSTSEESRFMKMEDNNSQKTGGSVAALKELCTIEGYNLNFQARPSPPDGSLGKESYAQVEVGGQILGKGVALTWEEAKIQAADEAIVTLRSMLGQLGHKRSGSPRSLAPNFNKRFKPDFPRVQRVPYGTYSRIEGHVP
ncbi:hypothetical protein PVAP13_1NG367600 [Panicum virgatum]|uniref:protein-serine/threonine phosphatase n=1 Tax=Panicum virgatum TaxID=38727 RepID=A0A8T0X5M9_PANVG|nr:hypothetical protein PVAP13_1NG367600 [Panicum virgatum]